MSLRGQRFIAGSSVQSRDDKHQHREGKEMTDIKDMTEYAGPFYIKYDNAVVAPSRETIADVRKGDFDRPVLVFESGALLTLNKTNTRTLIHAYGKDPRNWIGLIVEVFAGETTFQGNTKKSVLIRPISLKPTNVAQVLDDEIPF